MHRHPGRLRTLCPHIRHASGLARDYDAAIKTLNSVQSNSVILEHVRKLRQAGKSSQPAEVTNLFRTIGYKPADFNALNAIHIAGTKGKGSTAAFVSSILAQYPGTVGLYTSPHLRSVRERIKLNNEPISSEAFAKYLFEVWDRLQVLDDEILSTQMVYFRFLTLTAFHCYMREGVKTAVIECGIGGEEDTTNVLVEPSVTAVTSLGLDHQNVLGETIEQIAWHKAGIFKPGVPALTVPQSDSAMTVLRQRAAERDTELRVVPPIPAVEAIKLGIAGAVQQSNASLAVEIAATHLGISIDAALPPQFIKGLEDTRLGGRFDQRLDTKSNITWYLDGGHTLESIELTGQWFASSKSAGINILIFNQATRDAVTLARRLRETVVSATSRQRPFSHVIFCTNRTYGTGFSPELHWVAPVTDQGPDPLYVQRALAESWSKGDSRTDVRVLPTIEEAIASAREIAGQDDAKVLVTGSLHLVGGVIEVLESEA